VLAAGSQLRSLHCHRGNQLPDGLPSPDVYFLAGYGRAAAAADAGEWMMFEAVEGAWQVPLIVRTLTDGAKDAISPTYSGVYASPSMSSSQIQQAWSATVSCLRDLGVISVLFRHSPLVPQAPDLPGLRWIISGQPTIVLEPADSDSAWSAMKSQCRNQIRKALKNGYTADVRQTISQDLAPGADFRRLYEETMQRLHAVSTYYFSETYYRELLDGLGSNLLIGEVRNPAGEVVNSTLLIRYAERIHYHLLGSNPADARMGSNNLMVWTATQFAVEQGLRQFHLGGGRGGTSPRDSLFRFKHTFGGRELKYAISGLIVDSEMYQARTQNRAKACNITKEALTASNFFPAYRAGTAGV
jgi:hypothetical protein